MSSPYTIRVPYKSNVRDEHPLSSGGSWFDSLTVYPLNTKLTSDDLARIVKAEYEQGVKDGIRQGHAQARAGVTANVTIFNNDGFVILNGKKYTTAEYNCLSAEVKNRLETRSGSPTETPNP